MRALIFIVALAFTALLGAFTARDLAQNGATPLGIISAGIVLLFAVALIGLLLDRSDR